MADASIQEPKMEPSVAGANADAQSLTDTAKDISKSEDGGLSKFLADARKHVWQTIFLVTIPTIAYFSWHWVNDKHEASRIRGDKLLAFQIENLHAKQQMLERFANGTSRYFGSAAHLRRLANQLRYRQLAAIDPEKIVDGLSLKSLEEEYHAFFKEAFRGDQPRMLVVMAKARFENPTNRQMLDALGELMTNLNADLFDRQQFADTVKESSAAVVELRRKLSEPVRLGNAESRARLLALVDRLAIFRSELEKQGGDTPSAKLAAAQNVVDLHESACEQIYQTLLEEFQQEINEDLKVLTSESTSK